MSAISPNKTLAELVADRPGRARVLEQLGLDYCCGGKQPLAEACAQKGLDTQTVQAALTEADDRSVVAAEQNWSQATLTELIEHILATHHAFLRRELPRLSELLTKVVDVHGPRHPELAECRTQFQALREELESHMEKEECILFPTIQDLEATRSLDSVHCGSVRNPIRVMEMEHENAGAALTRLRELTGGYAPPADACGSYRALLSGLSDLEADLHQHIHKENNILFPRAVRLEEDLHAFR